MPSRRMLAAAVACILAGCGDDPAGPGPFLLLGRVGNPESHAELPAIRAGETMLSFTLDRGASGELDDVACAL